MMARFARLSRFVQVVGVVGSMALTSSTFGADYPSEPIKLIIPWPAGGNTDQFARVITNKMSATLGKPIIYEYRPGAGGTIGHAAAARAKPDGYTLLMCHVGPMAMTPFLKQQTYDPLKDFTLIGQVVSGPTLLVVHPSLPVRSVKELIDYAKAYPGKISYGSVGVGSSTHLTGELLQMMSGIEIVHVPYKGAPPIITDMLGGRMPMSFMAVTLALPHVRSGALRAIAVTSLSRFPLLPDLPTVSETLPGFELNAWHGLVAPAGTPAPVVKKLHGALEKAVKDPGTVEWLFKNGLAPSGTSPKEFEAYVKSERDKWSKIIRDGGITID